MRKLCNLCAAVLLIAFCASGCMKAVPLDEYAYVIAVGLDKGIIKPFKVSFLVQKEGGGENGQDNAGAKVMSAEGATLSEALQSVQLGFPNALNLSRVTLFAVSDELARDGVMEKCLSIALNSYHMRRSVKLMTIQRSAYEYFNGLNIESEPNVTKLQVAMMNTKYDDGAAPLMNIALFTEAVRGGRTDAVMPLGVAAKSSGEEGEKPQGDSQNTAWGTSGTMSSHISGAAIYDGKKMVGTVPERDICFILLGRGELKECSLDVLVNGEMLSLRLYLIEHRMEAAIKDGLAQVSIKEKLDCELLSYPEQVISGNDIAIAAQNQLRDGLKRVFEAGVNMNSDILGFGRGVSQCFKSSKEWSDYDWKAKIASCQVEYNVEVEMNDKTLIWEVSG